MASESARPNDSCKHAATCSFCHGKENVLGSSKRWMGHKDKIRLTSLKCRISKIPNSQICAFCRSMSVQSTGDNVVGMPCNEGDPVQGCMMWMDFGFPRIGFYCSNDFAA